MHRHGYQGRKLGRERDQRRALIKSLLEALIINESIETTESKAKEIRPTIEKLVTKAKKGDLHSRRQVISSLQTVESAHKLVDDISKRYASRNGGYVRISRTRVRRGDNTQLAKIEFVEADKKPEKTAVKPKATKPAKSKAETTKEKK